MENPRSFKFYPPACTASRMGIFKFLHLRAYPLAGKAAINFLEFYDSTLSGWTNSSYARFEERRKATFASKESSSEYLAAPRIHIYIRKVPGSSYLCPFFVLLPLGSFHLVVLLCFIEQSRAAVVFYGQMRREHLYTKVYRKALKFPSPPRSLPSAMTCLPRRKYPNFPC